MCVILHGIPHINDQIRTSIGDPVHCTTYVVHNVYEMYGVSYIPDTHTNIHIHKHTHIYITLRTLYVVQGPAHAYDPTHVVAYLIIHK